MSVWKHAMKKVFPGTNPLYSTIKYGGRQACQAGRLPTNQRSNKVVILKLESNDTEWSIDQWTSERPLPRDHHQHPIPCVSGLDLCMRPHWPLGCWICTPFLIHLRFKFPRKGSSTMIVFCKLIAAFYCTWFRWNNNDGQLLIPRTLFLET